MAARGEIPMATVIKRRKRGKHRTTTVCSLGVE